jgi:hypothetical protein
LLVFASVPSGTSVVENGCSVPDGKGSDATRASHDRILLGEVRVSFLFY